MRPDDSQLLWFTLVCVCLVATAAWLLRRNRSGPACRTGWLLLAAGLGALSLLALAALVGRLGPEHLWFREPTFYVAVAILLGAVIWWLRRPAPRLLKYGLPSLLVGLAGLGLALTRMDGRSMPLAMAMPTLGAKAPELVYLDQSGQPRSLSDLGGKVVLLNFWATWCTPCRREMPLLSQLQRDHGVEGLVVLYVSLEEPQVLEPFLASNHFDGIHGRLERAADYYDAGKLYPLSYLISRDGRVAYRWSGRPRDEWLTAKVRELL
jgi:thiol-disulfide isomerase/thioredoxin